jgi:hypothetical protein
VELDNRVVVTALTPTRFRIDGLAPFTDAPGVYVVTVSGVGVTAPGGVAGAGQLSESWTTDKAAPVVLDLEDVLQSPRSTVVQSLDVTFSEAIDAASFTLADISLTRNGSSVLLNAADVSLTRISDTAWRIAGINWAQGLEGSYVLTVTGAGIRDLAGNAGVGSVSTSWVLDITDPVQATSLRITPDRGSSAMDGVTNTGTFVLSGDLSEAGLSVRLFDLSNNKDLGPATVDGAGFAASLALTSTGKHDIRVRTIDAAGNTSDVVYTVFVDLAAPALSSIQQVSPDPRSAPVPSIDVTLSEQVDLATFTTADISLTRNGVLVELPEGVTVTHVSGTTYRIGGLGPVTSLAGSYVLTVTGAGISDRAGNSGSGSLSEGWTRVESVPAGIRGRIYNDVDGNGAFNSTFTTTDVGLSGWSVFVDANANGTFDTGELSTTTGADGRYELLGLAAGTYRVVAELRTGWISTAPVVNRIDVTVLDETVIAGADFGRFKLGTISGTKFSDLDADGVRDAGEVGLGGVTLFLDRDGDNVLDEGEQSVVTGSDGSYAFTGLTAGWSAWARCCRPAGSAPRRRRRSASSRG